jgi:hypothetical protein
MGRHTPRRGRPATSDAIARARRDAGDTTWRKLRGLFSARPERRPPNDPTPLYETHTGADDSMDTTRFLNELTDRSIDEDELGAAVRYDTIDRIRELSYGPDALPHLDGIPGEDWEYATYRFNASDGVWDFVRLGAYRMEHEPLKSALRGVHWPDEVATRIRSTWLDWNGHAILPEERPLWACLVRRADTEMWLGRDLGGEH